jgi:hypothetical protein
MNWNVKRWCVKEHLEALVDCRSFIAASSAVAKFETLMT